MLRSCRAVHLTLGHLNFTQLLLGFFPGPWALWLSSLSVGIPREGSDWAIQELLTVTSQERAASGRRSARGCHRVTCMAETISIDWCYYPHFTEEETESQGGKNT